MPPLFTITQKEIDWVNNVIDFLIKNEKTISSLKFYKYRVAINYHNSSKKYISYEEFRKMI